MSGVWHCAIRTDASEPVGPVRVYPPKLAEQQPLLYRPCVVVLCDTAADVEQLRQRLEPGGSV
jgi:hypothetical protein